jgi:ribosomal protein S18 acetylase RimI-like enzyme
MSASLAPARASAAPGCAAPASAAPVAIRRLGRHDLPAVERHLLSLGPADRRKRFLSPFDDAAVARYVGRMDAERAVIVGAAAGPDGHLAGIAEAHPVADRSRMVEVAVSVHPYHRREGLGRRLVADALALAVSEGAEAAVFLFAPENRAIVRLVASLGARVTGLGRAVLLAEAPAAAAAALKRAA